MILRFVSLFYLCVLAASHAGGVLAASLASAAATPNIVVFLSDDHSLLDSTVYGSTEVKTPQMQRIASAGLTFTHAYIATNFLGHGAVNPKANESDD